MLKINYLVFMVAFGVGIFFCYISTPPPQVVVKFPSPYNAGKVLYKDKSDTCYRYSAEDVACPLDRALIKPQPIMEDYQPRRPNRQ